MKRRREYKMSDGNKKKKISESDLTSEVNVRNNVTNHYSEFFLDQTDNSNNNPLYQSYTNANTWGVHLNQPSFPIQINQYFVTNYGFNQNNSVSYYGAINPNQFIDSNFQVNNVNYSMNNYEGLNNNINPYNTFQHENYPNNYVQEGIIYCQEQETNGSFYPFDQSYLSNSPYAVPFNN